MSWLSFEKPWKEKRPRQFPLLPLLGVRIPTQHLQTDAGKAKNVLEGKEETKAYRKQRRNIQVI